MRIEFDIFGDKQVKRDILRIGARAGNLKPLFFVMAKYFYAIERKQFDSQGGFASGGWDALKDATIRRKAKKNQSTEILRADDVLMKSLTRPNARFSKRTIREGEMFLGTTDPVAVHHQHGAPNANVPQRRPVEFRKQDRVAWVKMLQQYIITRNLPTLPSV